MHLCFFPFGVIPWNIYWSQSQHHRCGYSEGMGASSWEAVTKPLTQCLHSNIIPDTSAEEGIFAFYGKVGNSCFFLDMLFTSRHLLVPFLFRVHFPPDLTCHSNDLCGIHREIPQLYQHGVA